MNARPCPSGKDDKPFKTLQAEFARLGHTFQRTESADGEVHYFSARWGLVREFASLAEAEVFLRQVGGVA